MSTKIMICSPSNNSELFQYLCQRICAPYNVEKFSDTFIKGFKIEPVFQSDIEDSHEIRNTTSS